MLLAGAGKLARAVLRDDLDDMELVLDQVWTVHQREGDYNPLHFHNNARSSLGADAGWVQGATQETVQVLWRGGGWEFSCRPEIGISVGESSRIPASSAEGDP